ncbi:hypothetical protein GIB67_005236 [Kingdonia uniflora]|uniref:Uncharacterized protein n=1 Tax=Kingdonia uniflora TaxID=39325 RepID=A0A7J7NNR6_9MAGN|nr:hypothetical protein GIB67_005236 [Kingdonia uniflora]
MNNPANLQKSLLKYNKLIGKVIQDIMSKKNSRTVFVLVMQSLVESLDGMPPFSFSHEGLYVDLSFVFYNNDSDSRTDFYQFLESEHFDNNWETNESRCWDIIEMFYSGRMPPERVLSALRSEENVIDYAVHDILRRTGTKFTLGKKELESEFIDFLSAVPRAFTLKLSDFMSAHNVEVGQSFWFNWQLYMHYMLYLLEDYLTIVKESEFRDISTGGRFLMAREGNYPSYGDRETSLTHADAQVTPSSSGLFSIFMGK